MPKQSFITPYGFETTIKLPLWDLDRIALVNRKVVSNCTRYEHFRNFCHWYFPNIEWNPWLEWLAHAFWDEEYETRIGDVRLRFISLTGCGAGGKTFGVGFCSTVWWLLSPPTSAVVLTSTTKGAMATRMWPVVMNMYSNRLDWDGSKWIKRPLGNLIASMHKWQFKKGDDKNSIMCQAVESGDVLKAVENIKGQHTPRRLIVIDEANQTPEAIFSAIPNARKGCQEFIVIFIGNAVSKLDYHGQVCEPVDGWTSIRVEDDSWKTKGIKAYQIEPGWCLHFDGERSPNVLAKKDVYPYLYTYSDYLAVKDADRTTIAYWSQERGFWPNDDLKHTVLTESLLDQGDAYGKLVFYGPTFTVCGLDPAFGGDDCIQRFGEMGQTENGRWGVQLTKRYYLRADVSQKMSVDKQLAQQARAHCEAEGCLPRHFGTDATGSGRGIAAILNDDWSDEIMQVMFGGAASESPASRSDPRPGNEVYGNRVSELWWQIREGVTGGVLKGLDRMEAIELCGREYELKNKRYLVIPKDECKKRIRRSPDHADSLSVLVAVARRYGLVGGSIERLPVGVIPWQKFANQQQEVWEESVEDHNSIDIFQ